MMKVAEENIIQFERGYEPAGDRGGGRQATAYVAQQVDEGKFEHDARGLIVAILLCGACWAALGFFLLT